ncbi:MAG: hypothetical protein EOO89_29860, partial [Pedobacter sp.]
MLKTLTFTLLFLTIIQTGKAQESTVAWINTNGKPLLSEVDTTLADLKFLNEELRGKTVLGLGEASHGTREFYLQKNRMIQYAVKNLGFRSLGFEVPDQVLAPINEYVTGGKGELKDLMVGMVLY